MFLSFIHISHCAKKRCLFKKGLFCELSILDCVTTVIIVKIYGEEMKRYTLGLAMATLLLSSCVSLVFAKSEFTKLPAGRAGS
jgi:hypothetical protein